MHKAKCRETHCLETDTARKPGLPVVNDIHILDSL
jgi:hypothetical protein